MPKDAQPIPVLTPRRPRLLFWRRIYRFGGLVLACTFFMPAVKGCSTPVVPAEYLADLLMDPPNSSLWGWLELMPALIGPYLFGLLAVLSPLPLCINGAKSTSLTEKVMAAWLCLLAGSEMAFLVLLADRGMHIGRGVPGELWPVVFVGLGLTAPLYCYRAVRAGPQGTVALRWYGPTICLIWFGGRLLTDPATTYWGWWLSLAASIVMGVAALATARLLTVRPLLATLRSLVTCSLVIPDLDEPYCRRCGYCLIGLTRPRCPECGQAFDAELGVG